MVIQAQQTELIEGVKAHQSEQLDEIKKLFTELQEIRHSSGDHFTELQTHLTELETKTGTKSVTAYALLSTLSYFYVY